MYIVLPDTASPVGTTSSNAINTFTAPSSVTRSTRLRCPSMTRNPAPVGLQRILDSGRDEERERNGRRIIHVEGPNVRNDGETVGAVHPIDAVNVAATDVKADEGD